MVIFSDLHMGDGGKRDEFVPNAGLFLAVLRDHYLEQGSILVLNGDIEDLAGFSLASIATRWREVYAAWQEFADRGAFYKLVGNHDLGLLRRRPGDLPFPLRESLRVEIGEKRLWIFHGHQVSRLDWAYETLGTFLQRWILRPLGIGNYTVARRPAAASTWSGAPISTRGRARCWPSSATPTGRSSSRCRAWTRSRSRSRTSAVPTAAAGEAERRDLEERMERLKKEYIEQQRREPRPPRGENLYHDGPLLPCLFNSGSGIGRHGITALEIAAGRITLVIWSDRRRSERYAAAAGYEPQQLGNSDFFRIVLKEESLDYIFARIRLLG